MIFVSISHPGLNERNHRANKPRFQTLVLTDTHELFGSRWVLSLRPIRGSSVWKWGRSMRCNILKQLKQCCSKPPIQHSPGDLSSNPVMSRLLWGYWRKILEKTWKKLYRQTKRPPSESIIPAASWASWATNSWATMAYIALRHRHNGWDWGCVVWWLLFLSAFHVAFTLLLLLAADHFKFNPQDQAFNRHPGLFDTVPCGTSRQRRFNFIGNPC